MFLSTKKLWMGMALVASLGYSCQHDESLGVEAITGFKIALVDEPSVTETRSTPQELGKPTVDKFKLKIANSATGKSIYDAGYTKDIIKASAGVYDVTASFGDNAVLAFDAPYYEGKKEDIAIEEGDTASVTVECAVANALASVTFEDSEKFKELYSSYAVEVAVENSSLKLEDGDKRSAYYRANSKPTFTFKGVLKANGKSVEALLEDKILSDPATFAAKAHCRLTLALKEMVPGIIPSIVKAEVDTVTVSETLPMEWLPAPKVSATGFGENRTLDVYETAPTEASIDFTLSSPLQDIDFSVNFADENLQSLNGDYTLSALTNEQRLDFINAGIDIPIIGEDKPSVRFSKTLTGALLATNEGVVNNTFTLKSVKANDRTNADSALTYTIATHKPEFTVSVNANNCWSREFTVDEINVTKGNAETIKQNLIYQYYNGTEWVECTTRESVKGRTQQFNEAAENISEKTYKVRALYRGSIASTEAEATLETPTQLPNAGMEEWNYIVNDGGWTGMDIPIYYPWLKDSSSFWNTNNDYTTRYRTWGSSTYYNCFPAVSYTSKGHTGIAAVLRNTAAGSGNTLPSNARSNNKVPGMLFIGDFDNESGTISSKGKDFLSRPSQLIFYYTYIPIGNENDIFDVTISWIDSEGNVINEMTRQFTGKVNDFTKGNITIPIEEGQNYNKISKIFIQFRSSIYSGDELPWEKDVSVTTEGYNKTFSTWSGSILTIDDISLVYDK